MTVFEENILKDFSQWYIDHVKHAIETKPIKRKGKGTGEFEAVVNASGRLANSLRDELTDEQLNIYALAYIDKLVFGEAPRQSNFALFEIEQWLAVKGLDYNPVSVATNIDRFGSTIWQQHQGGNSGLLADIPLAERIEQLKQSLILRNTEQLIQDLLQPFREEALA